MNTSKISQNLQEASSDLRMKTYIVIPTSDFEASKEIFCNLLKYSVLGLFKADGVVPDRILLEHPDRTSRMWLEQVEMEDVVRKGLVPKEVVPYIEIVFDDSSDMDDCLFEMLRPFPNSLNSQMSAANKDHFAFFTTHGQTVRLLTPDYYEFVFGRHLPE